MSPEIVNITRYVVYRKIEERIKNPSTTDDSAFSNPYLRQKLLLRVLNNAVPCYSSLAPKQEVTFDHEGQFSLAREKESQIDSAIQENILEILQEEDVNQRSYSREQTSPPQEPSHWFG